MGHIVFYIIFVSAILIYGKSGENEIAQGTKNEEWKQCLWLMNCVFRIYIFLFLVFLPSFSATNDDEFDCFFILFSPRFMPFTIQNSEWFNFFSPYGVCIQFDRRWKHHLTYALRFIYLSPVSFPLERTE